MRCPPSAETPLTEEYFIDHAKRRRRGGREQARAPDRRDEVAMYRIVAYPGVNEFNEAQSEMAGRGFILRSIDYGRDHISVLWERHPVGRVANVVELAGLHRGNELGPLGRGEGPAPGPVRGLARDRRTAIAGDGIDPGADGCVPGRG